MATICKWLHVADGALVLIGGESDWAYLTTPLPGLLGKPTLMPHGRVVGGSSQMNGPLWTRGDPSDFELSLVYLVTCPPELSRRRRCAGRRPRSWPAAGR